jgi:ABC-type uncharacterized transport system fused permease/ATPase subunit
MPGRYFHVQVRDYSESISLLNGADYEKEAGEHKLQDLLSKQKAVAYREYAMQCKEML